MNTFEAIAARIRNLIAPGSLTRRDDNSVQVTTKYGRTVEGTEAHSYGFAARAPEGNALVFFEGGDIRRPIILPIMSNNGVPDLEIGDSALWTKAGGWIVARSSGTVELFGTDNGGVIKVAELKTQLDKNASILQTLLTVLETPINEPGNGSPSAFQAALNSAMAGKTPGTFEDIASDKVFHGTGSA